MMGDVDDEQRSLKSDQDALEDGGMPRIGSVLGWVEGALKVDVLPYALMREKKSRGSSARKRSRKSD